MSKCEHCGKEQNPSGHSFVMCQCYYSKPKKETKEDKDAIIKDLKEKVGYYERLLSAVDPDGEGKAMYDEDPEGFDC
jgi:hypothetical protein